MTICLTHLLLIVALAAAQDLDDESPPHILLIVADDLGWGDVGYHGAAFQTPVLDQMAAEGIRLERHYAASLCNPSRSMLLTGRHMVQTGMHTILDHLEPNGLRLEFPTLAERLKTVGYNTHLVGKWHLGMFQKEYFPTRRGFDTFHGFLQGINDYYDRTSEAISGPKGYDYWQGERPLLNSTDYGTFDQGSEARRIIQDHNADDPMFLYLSLQAPHRPFQDPPGDKYPYPDVDAGEARIYARTISFMDEEIGRVVDSLKNKGMWDNTLVIFMSDNGSPERKYNGELRGRKSQLWEGGVRVPALVTGGRIKASGIISEEYVHITDWFPTLLDMAGVSDPDDDYIYGMNARETIIHGQSSPRQEVLLDIYPYIPYPLTETFRQGDEAQAAIIQNQWKLLTGLLDDLHIEDGSLSIPEGFFIELHDIKDDPEEANDLSSDYPEVVTSLLQRLMSYKEHQVESRTYCLDPKADPLFHSGYWVPWLEEGTEPVDPLYCLEEQEITENVQDSRYVLNEDFYSRNYGWIAGLCIIGGIVIVIAVLPMVAFIRNRHRARRGYEMM